MNEVLDIKDIKVAEWLVERGKLAQGWQAVARRARAMREEGKEADESETAGHYYDLKRIVKEKIDSGVDGSKNLFGKVRYHSKWNVWVTRVAVYRSGARQTGCGDGEIQEEECTYWRCCENSC